MTIECQQRNVLLLLQWNEHLLQQYIQENQTSANAYNFYIN